MTKYERSGFVVEVIEPSIYLGLAIMSTLMLVWIARSLTCIASHLDKLVEMAALIP